MTGCSGNPGKLAWLSTLGGCTIKSGCRLSANKYGSPIHERYYMPYCSDREDRALARLLGDIQNHQPPPQKPPRPSWREVFAYVGDLDLDGKVTLRCLRRRKVKGGIR